MEKSSGLFSFAVFVGDFFFFFVDRKIISTGIIVAIVVPAVIMLVLLVVGFMVCRKRKLYQTNEVRGWFSMYQSTA